MIARSSHASSVLAVGLGGVDQQRGLSRRGPGVEKTLTRKAASLTRVDFMRMPIFVLFCCLSIVFFFPVEADLAATSIWPPTYAPVRRADGTERVCKCQPNKLQQTLCLLRASLPLCTISSLLSLLARGLTCPYPSSSPSVTACPQTPPTNNNNQDTSGQRDRTREKKVKAARRPARSSLHPQSMPSAIPPAWSSSRRPPPATP